MLKIIIGCYEQMLLGYNISKTESGKLQAGLQFTDHSHTGSIRTVACGGTFLASGSSDEAIFLFNLAENKEVGSLQGHEGTITCLKFPDDNFLISASEDGAINVWNAVSKWDKAKSLRGHKGPVSSFDVHPSGKLALSTSVKDGTLRTWNMISGRPVYVKNMKKFSPEMIKFSPNGNHYVIASNKCVQVYELDSAKCVAEVESKRPILTTEFLTDDIFLVSGEGGEVCVYQASGGKCLVKFEAHASRVKALHRIVPPASLLESNTEPRPLWFASVSSDGHLKMWSVCPEELLDEEKTILKVPKCILDVDTKARLTCVTSWKEQT